MKSTELLGVGLRLVGVYGIVKSAQFLVSAVTSLSSYFSAEYGEQFNGWFLMHAGALLFMIASSAILINFPGTVAIWLLPKTETSGADLSQPAKDLQTTGLTILGFFVLTYAIPEFVQNLYMWWQAKGITVLNEIVKPRERFAEVLYSGIQLALGLFLVLQAKGISALVARLRYDGTYSQ
ncbi:hypothetical protein SAMN04487965_2557 [Microbulbifer donghaiensis]|uniref:Uncharacterized protein n=1 Tax=Microbulbifer donghaiensis TaxID=494016 RepID=A0A1M5E0Y7_9GAMM|nr:hypothetical protein [Microbulbifer donghaiensis]SHF72850.1 hypothetical protein SAMN04487965_2557 [Microbulbifer donghaiensis]